jgi:hypothetical protein
MLSRGQARDRNGSCPTDAGSGGFCNHADLRLTEVVHLAGRYSNFVPSTETLDFSGESGVPDRWRQR